MSLLLCTLAQILLSFFFEVGLSSMRLYVLNISKENKSLYLRVYLCTFFFIGYYLSYSGEK